MKLAYYPGCVAKSTSKEYEKSTHAICEALGVELEEIDDWNCCGATHVSNELLATGLSIRNLVRTDLPVVTSCSICYSRLRAAMLRMENHEVRDRVNKALDKKYAGAEVKHIIEVIMESLVNGVDPDDLITAPLKGLKVAPYYGCLLTRPGGGIDSPENPSILERLIRILGAEPVDFRLKMKCCGGPIFMPEEEAAAETLIEILRNAKKSGADLIVVLCPLCHLMLDANQHIVEERFGEDIKLPVLYITQLTGLALGLGAEELGLDMNSVSPISILKKLEEAKTEEEMQKAQEVVC
ncbi:MAG: CoB--CoM heterodisulfide reductase iron-sulfur subunit B family protein [Methanotrichaceae archaeon]